MMKLLIPFPDTSASFTNGVEFGRLLEKMERGDDPVTNNRFPVHVENVEVIKSACKVYGYIPIFGEEQYGWVEFIGVGKTTSEN